MFRILYICVLLCPSFLTATEIIESQSLTREQELYLGLEHEAQQGSRSMYLALMKKLANYPLTPYAESLYLQRFLRYSNRKAIRNFLAQHQDQPYSHPLRRRWLNYLVDNGYKHALVQDYQDIGDPRLACFNLRWQLQLGADEKQVLPQVTELWLAPKSQPRVCDPLFTLWQESGYRSSETVLARLILAAKAKNWSLVRYLKTLLDDEHKYLAGLWRSVARRPATLFKPNLFMFHDDKERVLFLYGIKRLIFADPQRVARLWQSEGSRFQVDEFERQDIAKKLALSLAIVDREAGFDWLSKVPDEEVDESVKQWRLAITLDGQDWQRTLNVIAGLPEQMQTDLSVVYWKARAMEALGQSKWARATYAELAERRDYYGFLAANKLGVKAQLRHEPLFVDPAEVLIVSQLPNLQRAIELFRLGRTNEARREWNLLEPQLTNEQKLVAAKLAYDTGWYDRPIFMLAEVGHLNHVDMRFPLAFKSLMSKVATQNNLDPALLFAIARRESSFMPDAYSHAGAAGLMQLKPSTASYIAKHKVKRRQLFEPDRNVQLASHYWSHLFKQAHGNPIITTAAYNAGIEKVKKWLPEKSMPADAWIETIPYKETRNYVKAVVAYSQVYQQLLSRPQNTFDQVTEISIAPTL